MKNFDIGDVIISFYNYDSVSSIYKVVLLGDSGVGKTSLRKRYLGEGFNRTYSATIGLDFALKRYGNEDKNIIQIWDLAGQERFAPLRKAYYSGTNAAILIYDVTQPETFESITQWVEEIITHVSFDKFFPLVLIANKIDLYLEDDLLIVDKQDGLNCAKNLSNIAKMDVPFFETSAKTGLNVSKMFEILIQNIELVKFNLQ